MDTNRSQLARMARLLISLAACATLVNAPMAAAQAPAASGDVAQAPSPEELERLVGPIALYPDDLVAIILPAATNPLQIVQADRFLQKRKQDPKAPIDDRWDDSVKALVNYPEVVKQMSADLDWTADLGEAVVADQAAVLGAVQAFRRKAQAAGNLKSDSKQVVEVEKEIITIVPADPQVIYVPQYNPSTVVVYSSVPVYGYWPAPYPSYYYPYAPGAAFATGLIWGAAIGAAWGGAWGCNWGGGTINNNININRGNNNINTGNINRGNSGNRPSQQPGGGGSAWKSDKRPGQVSSGAGRGTTSAANRPGGAGGGAGSRPGGGGGGGGAGARPSTQPAGGMGQGGGGRNQAGAASASGAATRGGAGAGSAGGGAFGGYGSGNAARADSSRGASSRNSMSSGGGGASRGGGGGGARGGGGGGGRGGGGRR